MAAANNYTDDVLARLDDFFFPGIPWQRAIWDVGLVGALHELGQASDAVQAGVLSGKSVRWFGLSLDSIANDDPGAGSGSPLNRLRAVLKADLTSGGAQHTELAVWADDVQRHYLTRWREAVGREEKPGREATARALATHLVGERFSERFLHRWVRTVSATEGIDITDLFDRALELVASTEDTFEVLVLFERAPAERVARPKEWVSAEQASNWLRAHDFAPVRQHGGLLLHVGARDPFAAVQGAATTVERLQARVAVGARRDFVIGSDFYVPGQSTALAGQRGRRAEVRALDRQNALLRLDGSGPIDQSLELLAHLNTSPDAVAAAAGWSAVESLLSAPGDEDKVVTADRLASLVACSWPRAELTSIAWARVKQDGRTRDTLAEELAGLPTNRARAARVMRAVRDDEPLGLNRPAERMAEARMQRLVRAPRDQLLAVRRRAETCLRRLYRQRNLVVHGGQTAGHDLAVALRVAAPLVGAGLDRVTHSALIDGRRPLELAARASFEIHRAGSTGGSDLTAMLE